MEDVAIPFIVLISLGVPAAVLLTPFILRARERIAVLQLVKFSIESGHPLSAETLAALPGDRDSRPSPLKDMRRGAVLIAIGAALGVFSVVCGLFLPEWVGKATFTVVVGAIGLVPLFIGLALLIVSRIEGRFLED
jgi:hypothetical protein